PQAGVDLHANIIRVRTRSSLVIHSIRPHAATLPSVARAALALLIFSSGIAAAQLPVVAGVTYGQPKVTPGEYNGDLSRRPLAAEAAEAVPRQKVYRPRLPGPPSTKRIPAA